MSVTKKQLIEKINEAIDLVQEYPTNNRALSLSLTKLQEAQMWAEKIVEVS